MQAGNAVPTLSPSESPSALASEQVLFHPVLWRSRDSHFPNLSPGWQRRYQELSSIAEDSDAIVSQLPPLLAALKKKFLQAQKAVVYLLLDLAPVTMEAIDNHYLICRLEEWEWYLAGPLRYVGMVEQALATYAGVLREVGAVRGRVHSVNMRATVVETVEGATLLVPNMEMLNSRLTNWTRNNRHVREDVKIRLAQKNDIQAAMRLMEKVAAHQNGILPDPAPTALLLKSDEGVADIALQVWVEDVDSKRACLSSLHNELFRALSREGVSLAGPALDVVVTQG